jgi:chaperonin cofactor prefoldin
MTDKAQGMASELTERSETLRNELMELERQFNIKKEEFLKIQGALEAIQAMTQD